ncbi:MAG TPA: hypothetical protein VHV53_05500 [Solirubrobacterales bacterium]|jgi:hypothetical protein|nr:hypothetical protein [Solirubrobacterales bacterium]
MCALALCLGAVFAASAAATTATLRVVGAGNQVLAEQLVKSSNISVKASPKATCFGAGTGGSGKAVALKGDTALALLAAGAKTIGQLAPLSISDHFGFGLALCGVGQSVAKGKASWYLKIDHKGASVSGNKAKIKTGDEVLWDLAPGYPYPEELVLSAPTEVTAATPFAVHVYEYDEKGGHKPAKGVKVTGAVTPTDGTGMTMVTVAKPTLLSAAKKGDIPSAAVPVCLGSQCPAGS